MSNYYVYLFLGLLAGCVAPIETNETNPELPIESSRPNPSHPGHDHEYGSLCWSEYDSQQLEDGTIITIEVPIECNPFYIYKGYPDPIEKPLDSEIQQPVIVNEY